MKRCFSSLQVLAAAATTTTTSSSSSAAAAMSSRPSVRGGRSRGRGQSCGRRSYSNRANGDDGDDALQFVSGDSHFGQVQDTNRSFRPQNNTNFRNFGPSTSYNRVPQPPSYNRMPQPPSYNRVPPQESYNIASRPPSYNVYRSPQQLSVPSQQPYDQSQQFYRPPRPHFDLNQQFRPPWQPQQFRPRPPKDMEYRNWQYANPGPPSECERFTILSYNILADYLARDHWDNLYFHIPRHFLDWERRKRSILFELGLWSADIMCLQEVDRFQDLKIELELRGYSGIWKMRTGDPVDGCAIFWRNSRFKLLYEESLEFCKLGLRDNVAQICVFESLDQCMISDTSSPTSLAHAKKLVVCNIHVLFNPKRGEIKLGQVRVLLSRAHAISKLWDDAPVILCGDFNSTPKSPLYNFIAEQKLDLSEIPRNEVSGQASAEIRISRPLNPRNGAQSTEISAQSIPASSNGTQMNRDHPLDFQEPGRLDKNLGNGPFTDCSSQSECPVILSNEPSRNMNNSVGNRDKPIEQCDFHGMGGCSNKIKSNMNISHEVSEQRASLLSEDDASLVKDVVNDLTLQESCDKDIHCSETSEFSSMADPLHNFIGAPENKEMSSLGMSTKPPFPHESSHSLEVSVERAGSLISPSAVDEKGCTSISYIPSVCSNSCESTDRNFQLDEKMESLTLKEELEGTKEGESVGVDDITFLSELHRGSSFLSHSHQFEESHESVKESTCLDSQEFRSLGGENNSPAGDLEKSNYDPSAWTPAEIETATGGPDCIVMEHGLKLQSVYGEIQDSGSRDSTGEPVVTSYHRRFMGTVDYMCHNPPKLNRKKLSPLVCHLFLLNKENWRSEGLQTARVLAPIPKHAMLWTKGFPTKKWGSDHIALVSELAFVGEISGQNIEVQ